MKPCLKILLVAVGCFATSAALYAAPGAHGLVVTEPQNLPQDARQPGQSMALHAFNNGKTYLYIEQQQLGRLVILDVTETAHIRQVGTAALATAAPFRFTGDLGFSAALVCFPGNNEEAVVNFHNPTQPTLAKTEDLRGIEKAQMYTDNVFVTAAPPASCDAAAEDYQVLDTSGQAPRLVTTVGNVRQTVDRQETGTTFLLSANGLTVIRHPAMELKYRLESTYTD